MDVRQMIKEAMKVKGITQMKLAEGIGYRHQSGVANIFSRKGMSVENLLKIVNALDCDLVVRSRSGIEMLGTKGETYKPEWVVDEMGDPTLVVTDRQGRKRTVPQNSAKTKKAVDPDI